LPAKTSQYIIDQILPLHVQGWKDEEIVQRLNVGIWTVQKYLINKRVHLKHKKRNYVDVEHAICTICNETKHVNEFPAPRSNGKTLALSEISYCKVCQQKIASDRRASSPYAYINDRLYDLRARCKTGSIPFDLTVEHVLSLYEEQKGLCFYTDAVIRVAPGHNLRAALSIDRIVPGLGYVQGNVILCTYRANAIKQDQTLDELKLWMPGWYERLLQFYQGGL
jgi:hypothetical protein